MKNAFLLCCLMFCGAGLSAAVDPCVKTEPCKDTGDPFSYPPFSSTGTVRGSTVPVTSTGTYSSTSTAFGAIGLGTGSATPLGSASALGRGAPAPTDGISLSPGRAQVRLEKYPSGEVAAERRTFDGVPDGVSKEFYKNGQVMYEWAYSRGELDGLSRAYYRNGDLRSEWHYKKGKLHGEVRQYYPRTLLKSEQRYKDGVLLEQKNYSETGALITDPKPASQR
jgi:hypothetical protein